MIGGTSMCRRPTHTSLREKRHDSERMVDTPGLYYIEASYAAENCVLLLSSNLHLTFSSSDPTISTFFILFTELNDVSSSSCNFPQ
jgi:hypothetical protein